jgi:hypothetical protein
MPAAVSKARGFIRDGDLRFCGDSAESLSFRGAHCPAAEAQLLQLLAGRRLRSIPASGDTALLPELFSVIVTPSADFDIVTP